MQSHGDAVGRDVDPLYQQPEDSRLLGRVELGPHRLRGADVEQILTPAFARQSMVVPAKLAPVGQLLACGRPPGAPSFRLRSSFSGESW